MNELKKCKSERKLLLITLIVLILIYFSFPIAKIFQPKKIVIENAEGERYRFNIPSDWIYWKSDDRDYVFYNIWNKECVLMPTFWFGEKNVENDYIRKYKMLNSFFVKRELNGFRFWEIKLNPLYCEDDGDVFFIPKLNCFLYYPDDWDKKEKRIKKILSNWEREK